MKYADVIAKLSLREKCALLSGATVFETHALPNKGVPAIWLSDGPNGLRTFWGFMWWSRSPPRMAAGWRSGRMCQTVQRQRCGCPALKKGPGNAPDARAFRQQVGCQGNGIMPGQTAEYFIP